MTLTIAQLTRINQQLTAHGITKEFRLAQSKSSMTVSLSFGDKAGWHVFKYGYGGETRGHTVKRQKGGAA